MLKDPDDAVRDAEEAARVSGERPYRHLMSDLAQALRPRTQGLPVVAARALEVADAYWQRSQGTEEDLVSARVACWKYLDAKNGSSAVVEDQEDHRPGCDLRPVRGRRGPGLRPLGGRARLP